MQLTADVEDIKWTLGSIATKEDISQLDKTVRDHNVIVLAALRVVPQPIALAVLAGFVIMIVTIGLVFSWR